MADETQSATDIIGQAAVRAEAPVDSRRPVSVHEGIVRSETKILEAIRQLERKIEKLIG
jgi:hypothetical protein